SCVLRPYPLRRSATSAAAQGIGDGARQTREIAAPKRGKGMRRTRLSVAAARRVALAAQGFARASRDEQAEWRQLRGTVKRLGLLQIDSVNVLVRAHYLPLFSRLGRYDRAAFDAKAYRRGSGRLFEYWGHEASL